MIMGYSSELDSWNYSFSNATSGPEEEKELCNLAEGYSFLLQSLLGVLAFSTLIGE